mmetsp:Transcript_96400/g.259266  ORF Transcript_96400/g.259266 Transcript_96400/m.259266 type:complete len:244 (-) Transcript_96400:2-733(-)
MRWPQGLQAMLHKPFALRNTWASSSLRCLSEAGIVRTRKWPSMQPLAKRLPQGLQLTERTQLPWGTSISTFPQVLMTLKCPSTHPVAMRVPQGLQAAENTSPGCFTSVWMLPEEASTIRSFSSSQPVATHLPQRLQAVEMIQLPCGTVNSTFPVAASMMRNCWSRQPVASFSPHGLQATENTQCGCRTSVQEMGLMMGKGPPCTAKRRFNRRLASTKQRALGSWAGRRSIERWKVLVGTMQQA